MPNWYTDEIQALLAAAPDDGVILEVGSGGGEKPDPRVITLEYPLDAHSHVIGDVHRLPFRDGSFDLVFSQAVLEHVADPRWAVQEMVRVLKPGGTLHFVTAFMQPVHMAPMHFFNMTEYAAGMLVAGLLDDVVVTAWGTWAETFAWWVGPEHRDEVVAHAAAIDALLTEQERRWSAGCVTATGRKP